MRIGNESLTFKVQFSDLNAISQDLLDPDILDIEFLAPQIIIDAITYEALSADEAKFSVNCAL